jgi:preprotein translocase subunit SecD
MRNLILLAFATLLMGCTTTKISCSSFSLHIAADDNAIVDPVEYEKVQVAFYQARNSEPLWILRHSSFDGRDLEKAFITKQKKAFATGGRLHINIKLRDDAKSKLEDVSSKNVGKQMAMLLDGVVIMAPVIREPLHEVGFQITGRYTEEEANRIVDRLNMISGCK